MTTPFRAGLRRTAAVALLTVLSTAATAESGQPKNVAGMMATANASVPMVTADEARMMIADQNALIIDVRDAPELEASGKIKGAINISRGMLEFRADVDTPVYDAELRKDRPIILYCASGARAALSGKVLQDMGYEKVYNLGALKDWQAAGGEVELVP
jgi:rhodanese-related sulfurtransferase